MTRRRDQIDDLWTTATLVACDEWTAGGELGTVSAKETNLGTRLRLSLTYTSRSEAFATREAIDQPEFRVLLH